MECRQELEFEQAEVEKGDSGSEKLWPELMNLNELLQMQPVLESAEAELALAGHLPPSGGCTQGCSHVRLPPFQ